MEISTQDRKSSSQARTCPNVGTVPKQVAPVPSRPATSRQYIEVDHVIRFRLSYKKLLNILNWHGKTGFVLQNAWGEVIESLAGPDKALLVGSQR